MFVEKEITVVQKQSTIWDVKIKLTNKGMIILWDIDIYANIYA